MKMKKKYTVHLTLIEESTAEVEVEATTIEEAIKIGSTYYPENDLPWQYADSFVECCEPPALENEITENQ